MFTDPLCAGGKQSIETMFAAVFGHWANPFKYSGAVTAGGRNGIKLGCARSLYFAKVFLRPFNPYAAIEVHCPIRPRTRPLSSRVSAYRAARDSVALVPRDGQWSSRRDEFCDGSLDLEWPHLDSAPDQIHVDSRISRWRPHCAVTWLGGAIRK